MYAKHSKNINRNKSFHPLTYGNLRKTEEIQEKQAEDAKVRDDRSKELHKDQEQRRYDALVLGASSSGLGVGFSTGGMRMVDDIFADDDIEQQQQQQNQTAAEPSSTSTVTTSTSLSGSRGGFLAKFKKEVVTEEQTVTPSAAVSQKSEETRNDPSHAGHKRARDDDSTSTTKGPTTTTTGFITTSEVARLRAEHELAKKQQLDPLAKVQRHQDRTVADIAKAREKQNMKRENASAQSEDGSGRVAEVSNKEAIMDDIKQLLSRYRARQ